MELIAALVNKTAGSIQFQFENEKLPVGEGFRVNLVRDSKSPQAILAQSEAFKILDTVGPQAVTTHSSVC